MLSKSRMLAIAAGAVVAAGLLAYQFMPDSKEGPVQLVSLLHGPGTGSNSAPAVIMFDLATGRGTMTIPRLPALGPVKVFAKTYRTRTGEGYCVMTDSKERPYFDGIVFGLSGTKLLNTGAIVNTLARMSGPNVLITSDMEFLSHFNEPVDASSD